MIPGGDRPARFDFLAPSRILFGAGRVSEIPALTAPWGRSCLWVRGRDAARHAPFIAPLRANGISVVEFEVPTEPTLDLIRSAVSQLAVQPVDWVCALGGGSVIDAGKAIAALALSPGDVLEYLEVIGAGRPIPNPGLPLIAVPTTGGTGAEVTRNAVLASPTHGVKASLRGPSVLPRIALVDPDLLASLPPAVLAASGMDALTQVIEPFLSCRANPLTDALCRDAIPKAVRALPVLFQEALRFAADTRSTELVPSAILQAREELGLASLLGGLALSNAGLGAVHGFAAALGGASSIPHGNVCAALLLPVLRFNLQRMAASGSSSHARDRARELAGLLTGGGAGDEAIDRALAVVEALVTRLRIPGLARFRMGDPREICAAALRSSSMKGNPVPMEPVELETLLQEAMVSPWDRVG